MVSDTLNQRYLHVPLSAIIVSVALHVVVTITLLSYHTFGARHLEKLTDKQFTKEIYQSFIQVDVVALPDEISHDKKMVDTSLPTVDKPKVMEQPQEIETAPAPEKEQMTPLTEARPEAKKELIKKERLKAQQETALKKLRDDLRREKALKGLQDKAGKEGRKRLAGNIPSKGVSTVGAIGTAKERYTALVAQAIKEHFRIYQWQRNKGLVTIVFIEVYKTGKLKDRKVLRSSKDPFFDSAVLQAIDEARLPVPDEPSIVAEGITVEFRPEE